MQSKYLLIALAAFAVTTTSAQAFMGGGYMMGGLSTEQVAAFKEARELRRRGEPDKARDRLLEVGVDEETLASLRVAAKASREAFHVAIENNDFSGFRIAIEGTPLYDIITTEEDFQAFRKAHALRQQREFEEAKAILDELGVPSLHGGHGRHEYKKAWLELDAETRDALRAARQANDHDTVRAILEEAGIPVKNRR